MVSALDFVLDIPEGSAVAKIRVVLADDHQQMIAIVRQTLCEEFEIVGAVEDGKQAVNSRSYAKSRRARHRYLDAYPRRIPGCQTAPDG